MATGIVGTVLGRGANKPGIIDRIMSRRAAADIKSAESYRDLIHRAATEKLPDADVAALDQHAARLDLTTEQVAEDVEVLKRVRYLEECVCGGNCQQKLAELNRAAIDATAAATRARDELNRQNGIARSVQGTMALIGQAAGELTRLRAANPRLFDAS